MVLNRKMKESVDERIGYILWKVNHLKEEAKWVIERIEIIEKDFKTLRKELGIK